MKYLNITLTFIFCLAYTFTANAVVIEIINVKTYELFPVEYQLYSEQPTGYVEVKNVSDVAGQKIRVDVTVEITEYTTGTIISSDTLQPGKSAKVPLLIAFNPNILSLKKPISELQAQIKIVVYSGEDKIDEKIISHRYNVYSRNRIPQEPEKLTMFVNPNDRKINEYLADKAGILEKVSNQNEIAEKLYAMLQSSKIQCFSLPAGEDVKHPRELLMAAVGNGNSYDCSLLYAALLERYKVPVALAFIPQKYMLVLFEAPDGKVTWNNRKWTLIDMRELKNTFSDAKVAGATSYNKWQETGELKLIDLRKTWQKYQPVQFETMVEVIRENSIQYGIELAKQGEWDIAIALFSQMLEIHKNDSVALNNLGNLYLLKRDFDKAISVYQRAIENDAKDAAILLNIGMVYYIQGKDEAAIKNFAEAREGLTNYTQMCTLLGINPNDEQYDDLKERLEKSDAIVRRDNDVISRPLGTRRVVMFALPVYWKQK